MLVGWSSSLVLKTGECFRFPGAAQNIIYPMT